MQCCSYAKPMALPAARGRALSRLARYSRSPGVTRLPRRSDRPEGQRIVGYANCAIRCLFCRRPMERDCSGVLPEERHDAHSLRATLEGKL
jgi:hypothetical protein